MPTWPAGQSQPLRAVLFAIGEGRVLGNQNVNVALCELRKKLPAGYRIVNIWGVGWRLERPDV